MGSGFLNSCLHDCTSSILPPEPSFQPLAFSKLKRERERDRQRHRKGQREREREKEQEEKKEEEEEERKKKKKKEKVAYNCPFKIVQSSSCR